MFSPLERLDFYTTAVELRAQAAAMPQSQWRSVEWNALMQLGSVYENLATGSLPAGAEVIPGLMVEDLIGEEAAGHEEVFLSEEEAEEPADDFDLEDLDDVGDLEP